MEKGMFSELLRAVIGNKSEGKVAASGGSKFLSFGKGPVYSHENFTSLIFRETSTLLALDGYDAGGNPVNWLTELDLSGVTLELNDLIVVPNACFISNITFGSGSAIGYR